MIIYFILLLGLIQLDEQKYYCINILLHGITSVSEQNDLYT